MNQTQNRHYYVTCQPCRQPGYGCYISYGLALRGAEQGYSLPDVSPQRQFVEGIAALFNRTQLSPVHMYEVVEDILS
ncbi:MAG: DUF6514 family protein [Oscillospiraceae bacterium]|jgi:hypothetical protein|nr:DUF6514 family protein [Oscillospiraceae bacterium]